MPLTESSQLTEPFTKLLIRGLLAGLIAGILAGCVAFVLGEPHVDAAIALEEAAAQPHGHAAESAGHSHGEGEALVSRTGQKAGLFLATSLAGLALGAIFAVVLHYARRLSTMPGAVLAMLVAGLGWLATEAVPFFKYPANPPAVGDPDTITQRTWLWLAVVILGLLAVTVGVFVARRISHHGLTSVRVVAPIAAFLAVVVIGYLVLPTIDEVGEDFPATLLWDFRLSSLATQATLWLTLGGAFAFLTDRAGRRAGNGQATLRR